MADRFDLDAIDADDALLDLLAAGGESARFAGEHDPAVALLAELRLAVEVEDELPVETIDDPESFLARCAALNPVTDPFARKMAARGLALGVAAVAALSVSGVAAAVTGNPLSPYEKVIEKITEAVTPSTDFPKEQLEGYPVLDKAKIVKVQKNFQKKQEDKAAEAEQDKTLANGELPQANVEPQPPLARPPVETKPSVIEQPVPQPTQPTTTQPPADPEPGDPTTKPTDPGPTDEPTTDPSTPPETPPPTTPTDPPSSPPPTDPTSPPTTPTNNGETGNNTNPTNPNPGSTDPTTVPSTAPSGDTGQTGETGDGKPTEVKPSTPPLGDQPGDTKPAEDPAEVIKDVVPVLPTPSGAPEVVPSVVQFFGSGLELIGKHSNGKVTTGSVREHYAKGKHSTGSYAEGKHAAIARTHGSLDDATVLRILGVLNSRSK
ncbi:hypothetical protein [Kribbella albertanoniae]|uniref:Uncharacterized protein n=1 Tax=Kribbella albertanoniae TaxID=1266829 RepID=A0A4R4PZS6_9ACTN|nr:hypothetical protein [Kribbella albertanoniae]TDC28141.1 hypothetical protein E1261_19240 [Kribbella albertanoniae]